ncbi:hypothetical protein [Halorientalis marina]|uniref:hypothetical protein n=1 Tax=Halorientalis marina TaxID=2931976 RepID=UPI001FF618C7|nr:hypothetical protein [Halorientalis marina]
MGRRVGRRDPRSLSGGYGRSPGQRVREWLGCCRAAPWRLLVGVSPVHYDRGDMRRAYRLTRAAAALLAVLGALLAGRLGLTWLFVAAVAADPSLVAAFNLGISVLAGAVLAVATVCRDRLGRRRRAAAARLDRL